MAIALGSEDGRGTVQAVRAPARLAEEAALASSRKKVSSVPSCRRTSGSAWTPRLRSSSPRRASARGVSCTRSPPRPRSRPSCRVREWLTETDIRTWRQLFDASPSELGDLLVFSRARDARITSRALAGEVVEVSLVIEGFPDAGDIELREAEEDPPPRLAAFRDGEVAGYVRSGHHDDMSRLLAIGVPLSITLTEEGAMRIIVNDPTERTAWLG